MQIQHYRIYYTWPSETVREEFAAPSMQDVLQHAGARLATLPRGSRFEIWRDANLLSASGDSARYAVSGKLPHRMHSPLR